MVFDAGWWRGLCVVQRNAARSMDEQHARDVACIQEQHARDVACRWQISFPVRRKHAHHGSGLGSHARRWSLIGPVDRYRACQHPKGIPRRISLATRRLRPRTSSSLRRRARDDVVSDEQRPLDDQKLHIYRITERRIAAAPSSTAVQAHRQYTPESSRSCRQCARPMGHLGRELARVVGASISRSALKTACLVCCLRPYSSFWRPSDWLLYDGGATELLGTPTWDS
jgi:hypothetical protein